MSVERVTSEQLALDGVTTGPPTATVDALLRVTEAIETATTLDELLLLALNEIGRIVNVQPTMMAMVHEDGMHIDMITSFPPQVTPVRPINLSDAPYLQQVVQTRTPMQLMLPDPTELHPEMVKLFQGNGVQSLLLLPLVAQDRVISLLGLAGVEAGHRFSAPDIALLRILTAPLASAMNAFLTTDAARRRSLELSTLNDIAATVTSSLDSREVYHQVVRHINEYFRVDAGSLLMLDENTRELVFVMTLEAGEEKLAGVRVPRGQGVVGHVAETQQYEIVLDAQNDPRFYREVSESVGYVTRSILCVPMVVKGRTIGVIELLNKMDGHFTDEDAQRLMNMAATVAVAIENARLFQEVNTGRNRLEAILNSTTEAILMANMHGEVVTANRTAAHIFRAADKAALIGCTVASLLDSLRMRAQDVSSPAWLNETTRSLSEVVEFELTDVQPPYWRHLSLPVYNNADQVIGQLYLFRDISHERELARLRDDYTGMLVHDLRAPLTAIMNGITMVQRGLGGPVSEQQQELLGISLNSSQTMLEMVNTLLDIAKMEEGRLPLDMVPLSMYALADEAISRLRASAHDHQLRLVAQLPAGLPPLEADRDKLLRILQNLLDNAIKFSPLDATIVLGSGTLTIKAGTAAWDHPPDATGKAPQTFPQLADGEWFVIWVADHGVGIPRQYHERIFEKFGQVRGKKVRGTGLGLTFCKLATESHGGRIWVESEEGKGSTFALALPLSREYEQM